MYPFKWHLLYKDGGSSTEAMTDLFVSSISTLETWLNVCAMLIVSDKVLTISNHTNITVFSGNLRSGGSGLSMFVVCFRVALNPFLQCHTEGENCLIVSSTSSPGPSYIKVWHHVQLSVSIVVLFTTCLCHSCYSRKLEEPVTKERQSPHVIKFGKYAFSVLPCPLG